MASSERPASASSSTSNKDLYDAVKSLQRTTQKGERRVAKLLDEAKDRENVTANTLEEFRASLKTLAKSRSAPPVFGQGGDGDSSDDDQDQTCVLVA